MLDFKGEKKMYDYVAKVTLTEEESMVLDRYILNYQKHIDKSITISMILSHMFQLGIEEVINDDHFNDGSEIRFSQVRCERL